MKAYSPATLVGMVNTWKTRLGLTHWTVEVRVVEQPDNEGAIMEVQRHEDAPRAVISVAQWLVDGDQPSEQIEEIDDAYVEIAVVHELCHLHFRDVMFPIRDDVTELLGSVAGELLMRQLARAEEFSIDLLSVALVKNWPSK